MIWKESSCEVLAFSGTRIVATVAMALPNESVGGCVADRGSFEGGVDGVRDGPFAEDGSGGLALETSGGVGRIRRGLA